VTDEADVRRMVTDVIRQTGHIDSLVNLVGGFSPGPVMETDLSVWQKLGHERHVRLPAFKDACRSQGSRRAGRILHIAARAALDPFPGAAAYIVAKSALVTLIRVLALELGGSGMRVNGILPTTIDTPLNRKSRPQADFSKWVQPAAIAQLLVFLSSEDSTAINGALIPIGS
jgi:NAD(P)-dependent dehydrogenase (short-subunit alcohol dehydrogenase family)